MKTQGLLDSVTNADGEVPKDLGFPVLEETDVTQAVTFLLSTAYSVNITEIIIRPVGEIF